MSSEDSRPGLVLKLVSRLPLEANAGDLSFYTDVATTLKAWELEVPIIGTCLMRRRGNASSRNGLCASKRLLTRNWSVPAFADSDFSSNLNLNAAAKDSNLHSSVRNTMVEKASTDNSPGAPRIPPSFFAFTDFDRSLVSQKVPISSVSAATTPSRTTVYPIDRPLRSASPATLVALTEPLLMSWCFDNSWLEKHL
ncbi:uncharacterized protein BT62DRAFT_1002181 [Guyanagaster necrorhizus]|uniref:Uncharacterized protein n=1 Tax=Guyanagaster necrorhizus TaxID=856835 RepID=A0A9P8AVT5_9AGAR|nr:uncharacterized protein BT62DRAFT_1002181 [Guyanagaster necrorhizus MCA 3950]KAG7449868.1 hypothetical protein BT62DRAFT_1002181 [Guyanagaster necrorhizus MCA 3950]